MLNVCLLTSTELILTPDCNLLHLHSNDMNSLKIVFLKKNVLAVSIKIHKNSL